MSHIRCIETAQENTQALQTERQNSTRLQEQVQTLDETVHEYSERVEQQQQTISLLVSEKAFLSSAVEKLEHAESGMFCFAHVSDSQVTRRIVALGDAEKRLQDELSRSAKLQVGVSQLEAEAEASASKIGTLPAREKELTDKSRDQVCRKACRICRGDIDQFPRNVRFSS